MQRIPRVAGATATMGRSRLWSFIVVGGLLIVATACGSSGPDSASASKSQPQSSSAQGTLTVAAAASLTGVFTDLGKKFDQTHPGVHIEFNFGSSGVLETQLEQGAPADVFASADVPVMARAQRAGVVVGPTQTFARNTLEIVVRPGNPLGIRSLADLKRADVVALCATRAPCGASAAKVLARAEVELATSQVTRGQDVKATLRQVSFGDADAAIVYVTDARTVGSKGQAVAIPPAQNVVTDYPIAVVKSSKNTALAEAWIGFVLGPEGRAALQAAGFKAPS